MSRPPIEQDAPASITCPLCGRTSYNLNDVRHRYCGACHIFHDDISAEQAGLALKKRMDFEDD